VVDILQALKPYSILGQVELNELWEDMEKKQQPRVGLTVHQRTLGWSNMEKYLLIIGAASVLSVL